MGVLANAGIQIRLTKYPQEIKPVKPPDMNKKGGEGQTGNVKMAMQMLVENCARNPTEKIAIVI